MRKTRFGLIALVSAILLVTALYWVGCNNNQTPTANNITDIAATNPEAVSKVMGIQDRNTDMLMNIDGVVGTGTGVDENGNLCIKVYTSGTVASAGKIAPVIDGIPVSVEETGPFYAMALTKRYRPVPIGVSVGNNNECAAGTIGCVVVKSGQKYILSNNHVLARENQAAIGEDIHQPGRYDAKPLCANIANDKVADLSDFYPITFSASANNTMDAAIAQFSTTDVTCATLAGFYGYPSSTTVSPSVGLAIKKVGRTSSLTTGTITAINVTISVGYSHGTARFIGQFMTSRGVIKSGDSGSLAVTNNSSNNPVGLLFAGTSRGEAVGTPINVVLQRFNATICNQ
ncbi:MAG: hypothetical protein AB1644_03855 [Candidatus Zixiibacteriota bacterium]